MCIRDRLHYQWQGLLSGERCARVPPQPVCRCGGTGCKTEGEGSPERGKAQEKRLVSVKVIFPLWFLLVDGDLPDREIRQGYCFVIREVSRTFVTKYGRWYSTGVRLLSWHERFIPGLEASRDWYTYCTFAERLGIENWHFSKKTRCIAQCSCCMLIRREFAYSVF